MVPSGFGLGDVPPWRLFDSMAFSAPCAGVAAARTSALVVRDRMFKITLAGMPVAGRERAVEVPDLDEVAEGGVGLVRERLVAVVAVERRHGLEVRSALQPAGQRERPGAAPVRVAGRAPRSAGECRSPGARGSAGAWRGGCRAGTCRCNRGSGPGGAGSRWAGSRATRCDDRSRTSAPIAGPRRVPGRWEA